MILRGLNRLNKSNHNNDNDINDNNSNDNSESADFVILALAHATKLGSNKTSSGKDEGGPSKGGFLNNLLISCTVPYLCNGINGVYKKIVYYS